MLFSKARNIDFNSLQLCSKIGTVLERVTSYKYLGIWLDEKLDFKTHVDLLVKKIIMKLRLRYRNKCSFTNFDRKRIIEALYVSVLDYGDIIYGNASHCPPYITGDNYGTHHFTLYSKVGWPAFSVKRDGHCLLTTYLLSH